MATIANRVYGEPGSLYARCGGVFGISAFVDRCMDLWMADTTLNDNPMVTRWHLSAQRPGFKFLVAQVGRARAHAARVPRALTSRRASLIRQLTCNLTGGPQKYTGRPMDEAHKHLNISGLEWARA